MNTRLQVEHPVTEMVAGVDLARWQIRIARGERLDVDPARALTPLGHAIECRIYAEDPDQGFLPSPGLIRALRPAAGPGVRDDGGVSAGYTVPVHYDSLIAKLIAWGESRDQAIARSARALGEYQVVGIRTTIPFFLWLMRQPDFLAGRFDTTYLDRLLADRKGESFSELDDGEQDIVVAAAAIDAFLRSQGAPRSGEAAARSLWLETARREALRG
jgi:acetyl-CoA carboxylase biotin carboxylase subunit